MRSQLHLLYLNKNQFEKDIKRTFGLSKLDENPNSLYL